MIESSLQEELEHEHAWLETTLEDLARAADNPEGPDLARAWAHLEKGLLRHLEFEEHELFPLIEPFHPNELGALRQEHENIRRLLSELGVHLDLHTLRKSVVDRLILALRKHAESEKQGLYHWVERHAPADTRRHLLSLLIRTLRGAVDGSGPGSPRS